MAYHIFIHDASPDKSLILDLYVGSAITVDRYWESIGRKLRLPIISTLTEKADSENGLALAGFELIQFKNEMEEFKKYWLSENVQSDLPENLLDNINEIVEKIGQAVVSNLTLRFG